MPCARFFRVIHLWNFGQQDFAVDSGGAQGLSLSEKIVVSMVGRLKGQGYHVLYIVTISFFLSAWQITFSH